MSVDYGALRAAMPDDVWLANDVHPDQVRHAEIEAAAAAWVSVHPIQGTPWLTAIGDEPEAVARVAAVVADRLPSDIPPLTGFTVTTAAYPALPQFLRTPDVEHWTWWWTVTQPPSRVGEAQVTPVADDDRRLPELLHSSGSVYVFPGDPRIVQWAGVEETGELVACGAWTQHIAGVPHLASVVTRPDHRSRGLSSDVCTWLIRQALDRDGIATLGMYADNVAGRRVYERLGFIQDKDFTSGYLPDVDRDLRLGFHETADPESDGGRAN